jgi:hypothetical protein
MQEGESEGRWPIQKVGTNPDRKIPLPSILVK